MIKTDRLILQPTEDKYIDILQSLWQDEEVIKYTNIKNKLTKEQCKERITRFSKINDSIEFPVIFYILYKDKICGLIGCPVINCEKKEFGIFYQIIKKYWNMGIGFEATEAIIGYMKNKYSGGTIYSDVVEANIASKIILEKVGFSFMKEDDAGFERDGNIYKVLNYTMRL